MSEMASDTIWVKSQKALTDFIEILTCQVCHQTLVRPQQFLNCGHYACACCIGNRTDCLECNIPGEASDICSDLAVNDLLLNLNIIADVVGFTFQNKSTNQNSETGYNNSTKNSKKPIKKNITKVKTINETLNSSICDSTISKSSKDRTFESILKNIDKQNVKGETALHMACRSNRLERVKYLLEAGGNPSTKDYSGWTPLQEAASYGYYDICEILLKYKARPDVPGCNNRTALHEAVIIDNCDIVSLLIKYNAREKVFDNMGKIPRDYCKSKNMSNLLKTLDKATCKFEEPCEFNKKLIISTKNEFKITLYGSNLKPDSRKSLTTLGTKKKLKIANRLSSTVTHVVVDTKETNHVTLTFDLLLTILYGKQLLSSNCISILMDSKSITFNDLNLFEVNPPQMDDALIRARENLEKQNPPLFDNCKFYFITKGLNSISYDGMEITKSQLIKLVDIGGGITLSREPKPDDIQSSLCPFHVAHNPRHSLHKCTHYIIYVAENYHESNRLMYNMSFLKTLPLMWFIESILQFKLLDPIDLGLERP